MTTGFLVNQAPILRTVAAFSDNFDRGVSEAQEDLYDEAVGNNVMNMLYETGRIRFYESADDSGFEDNDYSD